MYEPSRRLQTTNVTKRRERIKFFFIANNGSPTNTAAKIYNILKLRAITKYVNFTPVTNLTFTRKLIGTNSLG